MRTATQTVTPQTMPPEMLHLAERARVQATSVDTKIEVKTERASDPRKGQRRRTRPYAASNTR
jgi:hypothetical protein